MRYMLDTNTCIYIINKKPVRVIRRLRELDISDVGISSITLSELDYGVEKSQNKVRNRIALTEFVTPLDIAPYTTLAAREYGKIRSLLESQGRPIGPLDTLIAAHALGLNCTLVTNNLDEFSRVPELQVENWAD